MKNSIEVIDIAIEAGVKRIYPSEFGIDLSDPANQTPALGEKMKIEEHLVQKAKEGKVSYTFFITGPFLDWGIATGFMGMDPAIAYSSINDY